MAQAEVRPGEQSQRITTIGNMPMLELYRLIRGRGITDEESQRIKNGDDPPLPAHLVTEEVHRCIAGSPGFSAGLATFSLGKYRLDDGGTFYPTVGVELQRVVEAVKRYAREVGVKPPGTDLKVPITGSIVQRNMYHHRTGVYSGMVELFVQVSPQSLPNDFQRFRQSPTPQQQ